MSEKTGISWTDSTWNPIRGCSRVSPGCMNCYAELMAYRYSGIDKNGKALAYHGLVGENGRWNGVIRAIPKHLLDPKRWRKEPRKIFVNSMSDLFHENLPVEEIARVFAVMALFDMHKYQVLTKRAERMKLVLQDAEFWKTVARMCEQYAEDVEHAGPGGLMGLEAYTDEIRQNKAMRHVWLGVSAENQECLVERWAHLKDTPAAIRWISAEPLLGPLDFGEPAEIGTWPDHGRMLRNEKEWDDWKYLAAAAIDWVVIGGESKQSMPARPCELEWLRSIKNQCVKHKVPVWMKQMGQCILFSGSSSPGEHWPHTFAGPASLKRRLQTTHMLASGSYGWRVHLHDEHGADPKEWPEDMRMQQLPRSA